MQAVKRVRKIIRTEPDSHRSQVFAALVLALESEQQFDLSRLYELGFDDFGDAIRLLQEWRLDRYYSAKFRLMDISLQAAASPSKAPLPHPE